MWVLCGSLLQNTDHNCIALYMCHMVKNLSLNTNTTTQPRFYLPFGNMVQLTTQLNKTKVMISGERQKVRQKAVRWPCGVCSKGVGK